MAFCLTASSLCHFEQKCKICHLGCDFSICYRGQVINVLKDKNYVCVSSVKQLIIFFFHENATSLSQIVNTKAIKPTLSLKGLRK